MQSSGNTVRSEPAIRIEERDFDRHVDAGPRHQGVFDGVAVQIDYTRQRYDATGFDFGGAPNIGNNSIDYNNISLPYAPIFQKSAINGQCVSVV